MVNHSTKTEFIGAKVHPAEKQKLEASGYNVRHAVEYFNSLQGNEETKLEIEIFHRKKELKEYKKESEYHILELECDIDELEKKLETIKISKGIKIDNKAKVTKTEDTDNIMSVVESFVHMYHTNPYYGDLSVDEAINMAKTGLSKKGRKYGVEFDELHDLIMDNFGSLTRKVKMIS